jgi:hypothetical protein
MKGKISIVTDKGKSTITYYMGNQMGTSLSILLSEVGCPRFWSKYPTRYNPVGYDSDIRLSHIVANAHKLGLPPTDLLYRMIDYHHTAIKTHQYDVSECSIELA